MVLLYIIMLLIPFTVFIWISYGELYRKHITITSRWPKLKEIDEVIFKRENSLLTNRMIQFKYLYILYLVTVVLSIVSYLCFLFILLL